MIKKYIKTKKLINFICLLIFYCFLFLLVYNFPYSGDDWAWGSEIGLQRFENLFQGYNGRYAGNLLVLLLTRSNFLRIFIITSIIICNVYLIYKYCGMNNPVFCFFPLLLILLTPKNIFVQAVVWTSGFCNYFPPIFFAMIYLLITKNIFSEEEPIYYKYYPLLTFMLGFIGALFMENITLYILTISIVIIFYTLLKFKKFYLTHFLYMIGSSCGLLLMFSNSVYKSIAKGQDDYRSINIIQGMKEKLITNIRTIIDVFFIDNLIIFFFITILCIIVVLIYHKKNYQINYEKKNVLFAYIVVFINVLCFVFMALKNIYQYGLVINENIYSILFSIIPLMIIIIIYCVSLLVVLKMCIYEKQLKHQLIFLVFNIPIIVAPLLFLTPIGPRCFFPPYLILVLFTNVLLKYIIKEANLKNYIMKLFYFAILIMCFFVFIFLLNIYLIIHKYDFLRNQNAIKQVESGYTTIKMMKLPYSSYVWTGNPDKSPWEERYKLFYNIDENVEFYFLDYKDYDLWLKNFDKEMLEK